MLRLDGALHELLELSFMFSFHKISSMLLIQLSSEGDFFFHTSYSICQIKSTGSINEGE